MDDRSGPRTCRSRLRALLSPDPGIRAETRADPWQLPGRPSRLPSWSAWPGAPPQDLPGIQRDARARLDSTARRFRATGVSRTGVTS
ncbi:hypothetical protein [Nonomuraea sp. NPDC050643]|uniref:hypothetical protein n=1 Tax=Nonomuraea sp. NPDC050643 TaxID=3155660 RepID=UPI0033F511A2